MKHLFIPLMALALPAGSAFATVIQIDFDDSANGGNSAAAQSLGSFGPAEFEGVVTGTHWNVLKDGSSLTSVIDDQNTPLSSVSISLANVAGPNGNAGGGLAADDASDLAMTGDMLFSIGNNPLVATVSNLDPGIYRVYAMAGVNVSAGEQARTYSIDFLVGGSSVQTLTLGPLTGNNATWNEGANYVKYDLTLGAGQTLGVSSTGANSQYGILNGIQIVAIPEPATLILTALGLVFLGLYRR